MLTPGPSPPHPVLAPSPLETPVLTTRSPWRALQHRNYVLFFTGHGLSLCGTWMQSLAMAWLVYRLTGSAFLLGLVEFVARAPILLLSVIGGVFADRWPRHRLMLVTQSAFLLQAVALAALALSDSITMGWVFALAAILGLVSALEIPVRQSFVADLVPRFDLPSAIGLNSSLFNAARIVGPSLAGLLVSTVGEGICFALNAASYLIILGCLLAMRLTRPASAVHGPPIRLLREALGYARRTPPARTVLVIVALLSIVAMPYSTLLPVFADDVLDAGPGGLGLLMAASGAGALLAALRHARRGTVHGLESVIARSVALFGVGLLLFAWSQSFWVSMAAMVAIGFGMVSSLAGTNILLQSVVPDSLRGRVISLFTTVSLGFTVFGSVVAGTGATYLSAPLTVAIGGVVTLLAAASLWRSVPGIRRFIHDHAQELDAARG